MTLRRADSPLLHRHRRPLTVLCATVWCVCFTATHLPRSAVVGIHVTDVVLHAGGYFVLSGLLAVWLAALGVRIRRRLPAVMLAMPLYAAFDELTQELVGRDASVSDWSADVLGAYAAVVICEAIFAIARRRRATGDDIAADAPDGAEWSD